jgi:hypothetical protein
MCLSAAGAPPANAAQHTSKLPVQTSGLSGAQAKCPLEMVCHLSRATDGVVAAVADARGQSVCLAANSRLVTNDVMLPIFIASLVKVPHGQAHSCTQRVNAVPPGYSGACAGGSG